MRERFFGKTRKIPKAHTITEKSVLLLLNDRCFLVKCDVHSIWKHHKVSLTENAVCYINVLVEVLCCSFMFMLGILINTFI